MSHVHPRLEQLRKEGESGRRKITQYTRYGTVALASFQALGVAIALESQQAGAMALVPEAGIAFRITAVTTLVTGTLFLMWLGEQISERGVGNGISIIIFAGIVAGLPSAIAGTLELARTGELPMLMVFGLFGADDPGYRVRRVRRAWPASYHRQLCETTGWPAHVCGPIQPFTAQAEYVGCHPRRFSRPVSFCFRPRWRVGLVPRRVCAGYRTSLRRYPQVNRSTSHFTRQLSIFFCFFYTALVVNPRDMADNLKKSGAFYSRDPAG